MNISDILNQYGLNQKEIKIHMAIGSKNKIGPWIKLTQNEFKEWQEYQNQENFKRKYILSFAYLRKNEWLFAGIYTSDSCEKKSDHYEYQTTLTEHGRELIGKMVIYFEKYFRASYLVSIRKLRFSKQVDANFD